VRYAAKFDASHAAITKGLKRIGWPFTDVARFGGFGCDIVTKHKDGYPLFLEIKNPGPPSSQRLTESEEALRDAFPEFFRVVVYLDGALAAIGLST